jgi:hypothetical protein
MPSASLVTVIKLESGAYAFSNVKSRKEKTKPSNSTDGSGKSKLNFRNPPLCGGTKTSLVEVRGKIRVPAAESAATFVDAAATTPPSFSKPAIWLNAIPETPAAALVIKSRRDSFLSIPILSRYTRHSAKLTQTIRETSHSMAKRNGEQAPTLDAVSPSRRRPSAAILPARRFPDPQRRPPSNISAASCPDPHPPASRC